MIPVRQGSLFCLQNYTLMTNSTIHTVSNETNIKKIHTGHYDVIAGLKVNLFLFFM